MPRLQWLEEWWRKWFLRAVVRLFGRTPPMRPDWRTRARRVLFIRNDGLGDLIVSIEAMRAIAESQPPVVLDVLASPQNAALARTLPFVNEVIVHRRTGFLLRSRSTWKALRRRGYDVVIDGRVVLRGLSTQTTALLLSTRAPVRIGVGGRLNDHVYTLKVQPEQRDHWTEYVAALAQPFGVRLGDRDWRPRLPVPDRDRAAADALWREGGGGKPRVLVNVSVGHPERSWPPEKFERLLLRVRERLPDATIVLASMPAEQATAQALATAVQGRAAPLSLAQVFAAISTADLLISPETAITHAASAFGIPTIALQRKGNSRWSPYRTPGRNVFADDERRLVDLPAERVIDALDDLIDEQARERGWTVR
jgi:ADP-heptose:LPS heptosyltransferase